MPRSSTHQPDAGFGGPPAWTTSPPLDGPPVVAAPSPPSAPPGPGGARQARLDVADPPATAESPARTTRPSRRSAAAQKWIRLAHVYTSMVALLLVLFFGATGLTLNHPEWTFGLEANASTEAGTLPSTAVRSDGTVELLAFSEYLRSEHDVRGSVTDFVAGDQGSISYRGPGYAADVRFDTATRHFDLDVEQQGLIAVMNDLHKGRDTNTSWGWLIDVSAGFLVAIAASGLGLQLFLRRRRTSSLVVAGVGAVLAVVIGITSLT